MSKFKPEDTEEHADAEPTDLPVDDGPDLDEPRDNARSSQDGDEQTYDVGDPLAELQGQYDEMHQRLLRLAADYENYKRRSLANIDAAREQSVMDMARALVTVLDHFDRALEVEVNDPAGQSLLKGVQMVRDELLRTLERFGVRRLEVKPGDPFEPEKHEALMRQAVEGIEPDHVAMQLQAGYTLNDKTLRPAQVAVAQ